MNSRSISKYFFVGVVIILVLIVVFYFFYPYFFKEKPYQTLTSEAYQEDTVISLYKNIPPDFPKEVILENKTLKYSGTVSTPEGKTQITISYISDKKMPEIVNIYQETLPSLGWDIAEKSVYTEVAIMRTTKEKKSLLLTIASLKEGETMVTFQYEFR